MATQLLVFPLFGLDTTLGQNLAIGAIFTTVSLARSYRAAAGVRGVPRVTAPQRPWREIADGPPAGRAVSKLTSEN